MEHRHALNEQVVEITQRMAEVNAKAIGCNQRVMETNENIVAFNAKYIEENTTWLANGGMLSSREAITPAAATELAKANTTLARKMRLQAGGNTEKLVDCLAEAESNRESILANQTDVYARRDRVHANREQIQTNQRNVQSLLRTKALLGRTVQNGSSAGVCQALALTIGNDLRTAISRCGLALVPPSQVALAASLTPTALDDSTRAALTQHRVDLFAVEAAIFDNASNAFLARSLVNENASLIAKNYSSVFDGNRQLADQNTNDLFRNRLAIVRGRMAAAEDATERLYLTALKHREKITLCVRRQRAGREMCPCASEGSSRTRVVLPQQCRCSFGHATGR